MKMIVGRRSAFNISFFIVLMTYRLNAVEINAFLLYNTFVMSWRWLNLSLSCKLLIRHYFLLVKNRNHLLMSSRIYLIDHILISSFFDLLNKLFSRIWLLRYKSMDVYRYFIARLFFLHLSIIFCYIMLLVLLRFIRYLLMFYNDWMIFYILNSTYCSVLLAELQGKLMRFLQLFWLFLSHFLLLLLLWWVLFGSLQIQIFRQIQFIFPLPFLIIRFSGNI